MFHLGLSLLQNTRSYHFNYCIAIYSSTLPPLNCITYFSQLSQLSSLSHFHLFISTCTIRSTSSHPPPSCSHFFVKLPLLTPPLHLHYAMLLVITSQSLSIAHMYPVHTPLSPPCPDTHAHIVLNDNYVYQHDFQVYFTFFYFYKHSN